MLEKLFIKWSGGDNMSELKNVELSDKQVGFVMKKYSSNEIGMYIPVVMSEIDMSNKIWTKTINVSNKMISTDNINIKFEPIELTNTYKVKPKNISNISSPNLGLGEKVWVSFVDNDLKKCIYTNESVDESQRTTDSYTISTMARGSVNDKEVAYTFSVDSDNKNILLQTTAANGEKDELTVKLDGANGAIKIKTTSGSINVQGNTVDIMKNLCINGVNIMDTLEAMRKEIYATINEVVNETNRKINNLESRTNSSIKSVSSSLSSLSYRVSALERAKTSAYSSEPSLEELFDNIKTEDIKLKSPKGTIGTQSYIEKK